MLKQLAWRFLFSKASDGFLSLITWVSIVGVSLGVLALVVVTSVINGFQGEIARAITAMNGDIVLYTSGRPVLDPESIDRRIREAAPEVTETTASFVFELMASGPKAVAGVVIQGFDPTTFASVTEVDRKVVKGRLPTAAGEVALTKPVAEKIGAQVGDTIRLIAPFVGSGEQAKSAEVKVVGWVSLGLWQFDSKFAFARLDWVQSFLENPGGVTTFQMKLKDRGDSARAARKLIEVFGPPFRVREWFKLDQNVFRAIAFEKFMIQTILAAIILVAAFNVVGTLMMMIHDKTREIAILKAMGFRRSQGFALFVWIGTGIGVVGMVLGFAGGMAVLWVLSRTRLIDLPAEVYRIDHLPVVLKPEELAMVCGLAVAICFLATLVPALVVSFKKPIDGLRSE